MDSREEEDSSEEDRGESNSVEEEDEERFKKIKFSSIIANYLLRPFFHENVAGK